MQRGERVVHNFVTFGDFEHYCIRDDLSTPAAYQARTFWIQNRELDPYARYEWETREGKADEAVPALTPRRQLWQLTLKGFRVEGNGNTQLVDSNFANALFDTSSYDYQLPLA